MNRDEALLLLEDASAHARGRAIRRLSEVGQSTDIPTLRRKLSSENVLYVRYALIETIRTLETEVAADLDIPDSDDTVTDELRGQVYGQAVEWVTGMLLHELASPIGLAILNAKRELGALWEASSTKRYLETTQKVFDAIEMLKDAAGVPRPQEFDLAAALVGVIETDVPAATAWISPIGPKPFMIKGDHALIRMVASNGIRNAVEAIAALGEQAPEHPIVVNWGESEIDYWISILDHGIGITGSIESAFRIGATTKRNHSGFGLAIAKQAAETMVGHVTLESGKDGGALYMARWRK